MPRGHYRYQLESVAIDRRNRECPPVHQSESPQQGESPTRCWCSRQDNEPLELVLAPNLELLERMRRAVL